MPCAYQCRSPFGAHRQGPCEECQAEYDELMDEQYKHYQRQKAVKAFRLWLKSLATDWEAPSQVALVNNSNYQQYQQITQRTEI